jgi:hypothetical protein
MPVPDDAAALVDAMRLGWYMAEVRGRNRPNDRGEGVAEQRSSHPALSVVGRSPEPPLLLRAERSAPSCVLRHRKCSWSSQASWIST